MPADGPAADSDRANPGPLDCCLRQGSWVQLLIARLAVLLAAAVLVSCTGAGGAAPSPTALAAPLSGLIHIGLAHWNLTAGYGAGWVGDNEDGSVVRVDARTGATRRYVIGDPKAARRLPTAVLSAFGSVWATRNDTRAVVRLDPDSGKTLATIPVGILPENLGSGEGSVWVDSYEDTRLVRIDPTTNRVAGSFDTVGGAEGVTAFAGSAWIVGNSAGALVRLDLASGLITARIPVAPAPEGLVAAFGSLWVASQRFASVTRIDPVTNSVIATLHLAANQTPLGLATDGHYIYAGGVSRIDPATNQIAGSLLVPDAFGGVAYGDGVLWVTTINGVYRVLPDGLRP